MKIKGSIRMIKNNFDEVLQKVEERFEELSTTINFLIEFKTTLHYRVYRYTEENKRTRTSALDIIDNMDLFRKHREQALELLIKMSAEHKISPQNKVLITLRDALEENDKLKYELKEEQLINALYTLYGEKDAIIERLVTFHKLKEQHVTEPLGDLLFRILDDKGKFTWFEKTFMKILITEVDFNTNVESPINNEFNILIYCEVGKRTLFKEIINSNKLLGYIENPIKLK